ncbi:MAG TPA: hypothetical protein VMF31_06570 [Solirubrobacterales bacterium]|nr:hypothetical protein [Solirubrobacterales bacterium]
MSNNRFTFAALLAVVAALVGGLAFSGQAQAQKVGNPGPASFAAASGTMKFGTKLAPFALDEDPDNPAVSLVGTVDQNGNVNVPNANTVFPQFTVPVPVVGAADILVKTVGDINGTLNPFTGAAFIPVKLWVKVNSSSSLIDAGCSIGTASSPIQVDLTTGTSTSVGGAQTMTGVPYDPDTGFLTVVDAKLAVPGQSSCGSLAGGTVNTEVGIPAASGNNYISLRLKLNPIITRGVEARITAPSFNTISGATRTMSAATSFAPAGVQSYRWDFDNDGTWDTAPSLTTSASHVYTGAPGSTHTARLRVVDNQGDAHESTKTFTIVQPADVTIAKQNVGAFEVGTNPQYRLTVTNNSSREAPNEIVVTDSVPAEFPVQSVSGSGWDCSVTGQDVRCARPKLDANETAPPILVTVGVTGEALPYRDNTAFVSSPSDPDTSNNSATVRSFVFAVDLVVNKSHDFEFRNGSDPKNVHVIKVSNRGTAPTALPTTVTDTLPTGLTPISASGSGWNCSITGQDVSCVTNDNIAPNESATPIEITSSGDIDAAAGEVGASSALVTNTATVANTGDVISSNNSDDDPTWILNTPDLRIGKSHVGNMRAGTQADYTITIANRGPQPTTTTTTVTDVLPEGMTFVSASGTGWDCSASGQEVTCVDEDPIAADSSAGDITITVLPEEPAEVVNVATVANTEDPHLGDNVAEDPTSVRLIDLEISAEQDEPFRVNRDGNYRISLENLGTSATASASVVTATLPTGVSYADWTGEGWNCSASSGSDVSCTYADPIEPGVAPTDLILGASFAPAAVPSTSVDFHVETDDDYVAENNDVTVESDVFAMDSSIAISHNGNFRAGVTRTYNVAVKNVGTANSDAASTSVAMTLANGLTYTGSTGSGWSCSAAAQDVTCDYAPAIAAEGSAASLGIQVSVAAAARPSVTTTAAVTTTGDRNPANDTAENVAPVASPDLGVVSSHSGNFRVGTINSYALTVTNHGDAATDQPIQITDTIPAGLNYVSAAGPGWNCVATAPTVTCTYSGQITAGASTPAVTLKVMPTYDAIHGVSNTVAVTGAPDFNSVNDSSSDPTDVQYIDLSTDLMGPTDTRNVGQDIAYKVNVASEGTAATISPIAVTGTLPAGVVPSSASGTDWNCQITGQVVNCVRPSSLAAQAVAPEITIRALIKPAASSPVSFQMTSTTVDSVTTAATSNEVITPIIAGPDGTVSLQAAIPENLTHLRVGGSGVYHVTATNRGGLPTAVGTSVEVNLPEGLNPGLSGSDDWPCYVLERKITCTYVPAIPAGESTPSFPINFTVDDSAGDLVTARAKVNVAGDLDTGNDETADMQEIDRTDVGVSTSQVGTWTQGGTGAFKVTVDNTGSGKTVGPIKVNADLPPGTTFNSVSGSGWNCTPSGLSVNCQRDAILNGNQSAPDIEITTDIGDSAADKAEASATVTTAEDIDPTNDSAKAAMTIAAKPVTPDVKRAATVDSKTAKMNRNGTVSIKLSCPADATVKCVGTVSASTSGKVKMGTGKKAKKKKLSTGKVSYSIAPGQTYPVIVKFTGKSKKAISAKRTVKLTVNAMPTTSDLAPSKGTLTLKTR